MAGLPVLLWAYGLDADCAPAHNTQGIGLHCFMLDHHHG